MERFYFFAADGRRCGPLELSVLKKLAQNKEILPVTTLEAEDGRRFRADEKLSAVDFDGRTTEGASREEPRIALEKRDADSLFILSEDFAPLYFADEDDAGDAVAEASVVVSETAFDGELILAETTFEAENEPQYCADEKLPAVDFDGRAPEAVRAAPYEPRVALEKRRFGKLKISRAAFYLAYVGILGLFGVFLTVCGVVAAFKSCLKRAIAAPAFVARSAFGASKNNENESTAPEARKFDDAKFLRLASGVGLAAICVVGAVCWAINDLRFDLGATLWKRFMGLLFLGGGIIIILAPILAPILAFAGCFDAKSNRINANEEKEAEPGVPKRRGVERKSEKTTEEPKSDAARKRGVGWALIGAAFVGVAVASGLTASTWGWSVGAGGLGALCLAFAVGELISALILRD